MHQRCRVFFQLFVWLSCMFSYLIADSNGAQSIVLQHQEAYSQLIHSYKTDGCVTHWKTGADMKSHLLAEENAHRCIITLTGATWDGHFKRYLQYQIYRRTAQLFCHHPGIDFGIFFYETEKLPHVLKDPNTNSNEAVWQKSDPTFEIYAFRNGSLIDHQTHRRPWLRQFRDWDVVTDEEITGEVKRMCIIGDGGTLLLHVDL